MDKFHLIIKALSKTSETFSFLMNLADICADKGDFENSILIRNELLAKDIDLDTKIKVLDALSSDFHKAGMYEEALKVLKEALIISNDKDRFLDMLSHIYTELNEWENVVNYQKMKKNKDYNFIIYALCQWADTFLKNGDEKNAYLKLKEAEMIDAKSIHFKLHLTDFYIKTKQVESLQKLADDISNNYTNFFGIFLKKFFSNHPVDKNIKELVLEHLSKYKKDSYTVYVYSKKLVQEQKFLEAYEFLLHYYVPPLYNPYLLKLMLECCLKTGKPLNNSYLEQLLLDQSDVEKWFRCENCGYETENFSFLCMRCNKFNTLNQNTRI